MNPIALFAGLWGPPNLALDGATFAFFVCAYTLGALLYRLIWTAFEGRRFRYEENPRAHFTPPQSQSQGQGQSQGQP